MVPLHCSNQDLLRLGGDDGDLFYVILSGDYSRRGMGEGDIIGVTGPTSQRIWGFRHCSNSSYAT